MAGKVEIELARPATAPPAVGAIDRATARPAALARCRDAGGVAPPPRQPHDQVRARCNVRVAGR